LRINCYICIIESSGGDGGDGDGNTNLKYIRQNEKKIFFSFLFIFFYFIFSLATNIMAAPRKYYPLTTYTSSPNFCFSCAYIKIEMPKHWNLFRTIRVHSLASDESIRAWAAARGVHKYIYFMCSSIIIIFLYSTTPALCIIWMNWNEIEWNATKRNEILHKNEIRKKEIKRNKNCLCATATAQ
jgi:hypothetical protein